MAPGTTPSERELLTFTLDAMPRSRLETLGERSVFDAAIVANHDDHGEPRRVGVVKSRVGEIRLGDGPLQGFAELFNGVLSAIAEAPENFVGLRSEGTLSLLRKLARHGASLHRAIYKHNKIGPGLVTARRIQIVTARVDGFLPLELAYRWEAPGNDAELCVGAEDALGSTDIASAGTCAARCGAPGGTAKRLCPMGFWCLWKTIERFEHRAKHIKEPADYSLRAEPIGKRPKLPRPEFGLVAGSDRARSVDIHAVDNVVAGVKSAFSGVGCVTSWEEWSTEVCRRHPGLLVVLPHHIRREGLSVLQIGADSELESTLVTYRHVVGEPPPHPPPAPILLLLGCETQDAPNALERFPAAFQDHGAAIVIGTVATVLGRHAGPVAEELIRLLAERPSDDRSFGDLLGAARRKLLLDGKAMALALAGFGDADWRLS
jgi:hypothetical protein